MAIKTKAPNRRHNPSSSAERPIKLAASIRRLLMDGYVPMDILVGTPEELRHRINIGDPFIKKILRDGQVIYAQDSAGMG